MTTENLTDYMESLALCMADSAEHGDLDSSVYADLSLLMADLAALSRSVKEVAA